MPRFGCAREIIVVTVEAGTVLNTRQLTVAPQNVPPTLAEEHVSLVICGGIHPRFQQQLHELNIDVVWGVMGHWRDVLQAYLNGTLQHDRNLCMQRRHSEGCRLRHGHQGRK